MSFVEEVFCSNYILLHYNGRFVIYSKEDGKPLVDSSFTEGKVLAYLLEFHDCEKEDDEGFVITTSIDEAKERGFTGGSVSFEDCIATNKLGVDGSPITYDAFIVSYFQKGTKELYRCETCEAVIRIGSDVSEFTGNGGTLRVADYCKNCSSYKAMYEGI